MFERNRAFDSFWSRMGHTLPVVSVVVWAVALGVYHSTGWFWLLYALGFASYGFGWTVRRHYPALRAWMASQMVKSNYARIAEAADLAEAINQGRIRRYRVRLKDKWSDPWSVCRASAFQACRGAEVEVVLMAECVRLEGQDPRTHVLFPPFLLFRSDGDYLEFQADSGFILGRCETDDEQDPEQPVEVLVEEDVAS